MIPCKNVRFRLFFSFIPFHVHFNDSSSLPVHIYSNDIISLAPLAIPLGLEKVVETQPWKQARGRW